MSDPMQFDGDAARLKTRFNARNVHALGARIDGELVGSNFMTTWGSYSWIGPLSVHPNLWNEGIAQQLLRATLESYDRNRQQHLALYTVAESAKHVALYRKFGFWPGYLTLIMERSANTSGPRPYITYSNMPAKEQPRLLEECALITKHLYPGLDLSQEILSLNDSALGDTIIIDAHGATAFAICHCGPGSEAASGTAYIKFAAARGNADFDQLLAASQDFCMKRGLKTLIAGVNTSRREAYDAMVKNGFRAILQGVAMHRPDEPAYDRPKVFVIDDLR